MYTTGIMGGNINMKDSIIEEIHIFRNELLSTFEYDIHALCEDLRKNQKMDNREVVMPKPKPAQNTIHAREA